MFKKMTFQPTLSDLEDQKRERMVNRARIMTAAQFHNREEKEGKTEAGNKNEPQTKTMRTIWKSIPH